MLSQTAEHALRALLFLAQRAPGEAVPADEIAAALGAPPNYLAKTLNALAKAGIVTSSRGRSGGFRLRADPDELTLGTVAALFGEGRARTMCLLGGRPCSDRTPCAAHDRWKSVEAEARAPLERTCVAALLG